ncbi:MAG: methyltransferase [Hyphomicrobiaceae bacterium]|nr:methyltransferase [Hyphomicrobiaceae bacterium]
MSRWRQDPDGAAAEIIRRSRDVLALDGRVLLAGCGPQTLDAVRTAGLAPTHWSRRLTDTAAATPWPPAGPFDAALLRLAKARDEALMSLHAVAGVLAEGGRIVLLGGNDEGIRSGEADLAALCGTVETLATRSHGRILAAPRPAGPLRSQLADWRRVVPLDLAGEPRAWVTYPGLFASGTLDEGTALLLSALPALRVGARVLDFACGSGPIAGAVRICHPDAVLDMLDADTVALAAAAENVARARTIAGTSLAAIGSQRYDAILSNPPLHTGVAEDHGALERLVAQALQHLSPGGVLQLVVQRRVALGEALAALFSAVDVVAESGRFRVWRAAGSTRQQA